MPDLLAAVKLESPPESAVPAPELSPIKADEQAYEQRPESKEHFLEEAQEAPKTSAAANAPVPRPKPQVAAPTRTVDDVTLHVEQILEKDLGDLYATLPESAKPLFKKKGEDVSHQIATMVRTFRVEASRVVRLIRDWLLTIPNVNTFFLEQEAKIKTDALLEYDAARREDRAKQP
jgi:hypothetical protein